jgi:hypothetical protein
MNNPPAFPIQGHSTRNGQGFQLVMSDGMTLRDYFAAKAMQAFITLHEEALNRDGACYDWSESGSSSEIVSEQAYGVADAMLKARGQ